MRINLGYQIAKFLFRQANDPEVKGIYCGVYITKLLKEYAIFEELKVDLVILSSKITDGPFCLWGLVKLTNHPTTSRYFTPPRGVLSLFTPSTS